MGEGVALCGCVAVVRGGWFEWSSVVVVVVVWVVVQAGEGLGLDLALREGGQVVWMGFVGCMVDVRVEICCLEGSVETELGHSYGRGCFCFAVGGNEAAGCWNHVFAFETSAVHAVCKCTCAIPRRSEDVITAFQFG